MNIYRQKFTAVCPNNGRKVDYRLELRASVVIMVEDLQAATVGRTGYHEAIADELFALFGGSQSLSAHHHGTDIETVRP